MRSLGWTIAAALLVGASPVWANALPTVEPGDALASKIAQPCVHGLKVTLSKYTVLVLGSDRAIRQEGPAFAFEPGGRLCLGFLDANGRVKEMLDESTANTFRVRVQPGQRVQVLESHPAGTKQGNATVSTRELRCADHGCALVAGEN